MSLIKPLYEVGAVRQIDGEHQRRWFTSSAMDLFVWRGACGTITGFQISYDKGQTERALTWKWQAGLTHARVDDGESHTGARYKEAPLLHNGGQPDIERIGRLLRIVGSNVPAEIMAFVMEKMSGQAVADFGAK